MLNSWWIIVLVMIFLFKISKIDAQNKSDVLILKSVNYPIIPINTTSTSLTYGNASIGQSGKSINSQQNKKPFQINQDAEQIFLPLSPNNYHPEKVLERIRVRPSSSSSQLVPPSNPTPLHNNQNQHNRNQQNQQNQHNHHHHHHQPNNYNHQPSEESLLDFSTYIVRPLHFDYAKELAEARASVKPLIFRPDSLHDILINNGYVVQPLLNDDDDANDSIGNGDIQFRPTIMQIIAPTINRDINQYHQNSGVQYQRLQNSSSDGYNPLSVNYNPYGSSYQAYQPHSNQPRAEPLIRQQYQIQEFARPNMKLAAIGFSFFDELRKQNENPTNSYFAPYSTPIPHFIEANSNKQYSTFPPLQLQSQQQQQQQLPIQQQQLPQQPLQQQQLPIQQQQQQQHPYASPLIGVEPIRNPLYYKRNVTKSKLNSPIPSTLSTFTSTIRAKPAIKTTKTTTTTEKDEDYETTTKQTLEPPYYRHDRYTSAYNNPFNDDSSQKYHSKFTHFNDDDDDDNDSRSSDDDDDDSDYNSSEESSNGKYRYNHDRDNDSNDSGEEDDSFYESTQHSKNTKKPIFEKKILTTKKPNQKSNKPLWIKPTTGSFTSEFNNNKPRFSKLIAATTRRPPTTKSTFIETTSTADILEEDLEFSARSNPDNKDEQYSYQEIKTFTDSLKPGLKINKYSRIKVIRHDKPSLPPPTSTSITKTVTKVATTPTTTERPQFFGTKRNSQKSKEYNKKINSDDSKYHTKSKSNKLIKNKSTIPQTRGNVKFLYDDLIYHPEESRMISTIYTENGVVVKKDQQGAIDNDGLTAGEASGYGQLRSQMQGYRYPYDHQKDLHLISSTTPTPMQPLAAASYPQIRYSSGPLLFGRISSEVERFNPSAKKSPPPVPPTTQPRQEERRYFQDIFTAQLSPSSLEYGHVMESPNGWEERYERQNSDSNRHQGKVRWGDKDGGFGEHYYDLNHHKPTN